MIIATAKVAKILPIPKTADPNRKSTANSLLQKGFNRQPGAALTIMPIRLPDGRYLTGLDELAPHVLKIADKTAREIEQKIILERKERLEKQSGLDLNPRSFYYSKISSANPQSGIYTDEKSGTSTKVATMCHLQDGENKFNFADPIQEITFLWVSLHPNIAPSLEDYKSGKVGPSVQFYVNDPDKEADIIYKENQTKDKAIIDLSAMSIDKRKKVARLIGLLISDNDKESEVYNQLREFIQVGVVASGEFKGYKSVTLFNSIASLKDNILEGKSIIKDALSLGIYRAKHKAIFEGENQISEDQDDLLKKLLSNAGQEDYLALQQKVANKRGILPTK